MSDVMTFELHRHDARHISGLLAPGSVDLIVTSPPYFALRSYRDDGEHYDGQLGSEATPREFVDNLIACTADWLKVLKPSGSLFVNLGDKFALNNRGSGYARERGLQDSTHSVSDRARMRRAFDGIKEKSRMGLPWRYAIRCIDELGLILRADIIWSKPNGLPESVTDRVRMSHEYLFHFTRQGRYFAAIDEVREAYDADASERRAKYGRLVADGYATGDRNDADRGGPMGKGGASEHALGKVPGSVWSMPSEPLVVPDHLGVDHFAAYPSELPRRCILGWTPSGWCVECGEARRAVVDAHAVKSPVHGDGSIMGNRNGGPDERGWDGLPRFDMARTITGYACACPTTDAPTRPAVVADFFCGTGTTPAVAHLLGRHGIGVDLSRDYLRLAAWRCTSDRALKDKVLDRSGIPNPAPPRIPGQLDLFAEGGS